jgi:hypothetical protein
MSARLSMAGTLIAATLFRIPLVFNKNWHGETSPSQVPHLRLCPSWGCLSDAIVVGQDRAFFRRPA